jgi:hypothetical protein
MIIVQYKYEEDYNERTFFFVIGLVVAGLVMIDQT